MLLFAPGTGLYQFWCVYVQQTQTSTWPCTYFICPWWNLRCYGNSFNRNFSLCFHPKIDPWVQSFPLCVHLTHRVRGYFRILIQDLAKSDTCTYPLYSVLKDPWLCEQMIFTMTGQHRQGERNAFTDLHTAPWKAKYILTAYIEIKRVSSSAANQIQLIKWSLASMDTFVKAEVLLWSELVQTLKCSKKLQK